MFGLFAAGQVLAMPRFNVSDYMKEKKRLRQSLVMENRHIKTLNDNLNVMAVEKERKTKELAAIKAKHRRIDEKVHFVIYPTCIHVGIKSISCSTTQVVNT